MYEWMYECMTVWMYECMNVWIYVWVYEYMNVCMYVCRIYVWNGMECNGVNVT